MIALLRSRWFLLFFFLSGFCSLVDEVVWLRLAMASFGVTTATVSLVLSVFMGGIALGSWAVGRLTAREERWTAGRLLRLYAAAELVIGLSAVVVPPLLRFSQTLLATAGNSIEWGSSMHYVVSGLCITAAFLPFTFAMGATFPLAMASLRRMPDGRSDRRSFSYLYIANVLGAAAGTVASAVILIETLGFQATLFVAAALNVLVAAGAFAISRVVGGRTVAQEGSSSGSPYHTHDSAVDKTAQHSPKVNLALLFLTGFTSMALEVVWVRLFTPYLGTVVYAFATILTVYLLATFFGTAVYRAWSSLGRSPATGPLAGTAWFCAGFFAMLSLLGGDPRLAIAAEPAITRMSVLRVILGLVPFCAAVGFLTVSLVDRWSSGDPKKAGTAYAWNVIGCIVGPILTSFLLLPTIGERGAMVALSAPMLAVGLFMALSRLSSYSLGKWKDNVGFAAIVVLAVASGFLFVKTHDYETTFPKAIVKRDATATVVATGEGMTRQLIVNGSGMTVLDTITKTIAHLPLAFVPERPRNALVICFGMGTSFRSATAWNIPVTAVELVPSVPKVFSYFHADAEEVFSRPGARVVIDDGRRYLERTREKFDVITVDPPPPIEAAGSSNLYSTEFYEAARRRLQPGGILQQWFMGSNARVTAAVARSIRESFPYVRVFRSFKGWGLHFLASDQPIAAVTAQELAAKVPPPAVADLTEWEPGKSPAEIFEAILRQEVSIDQIIADDPKAPVLTDDRPVNEYYLLHRRAFR